MQLVLTYIISGYGQGPQLVVDQDYNFKGCTIYN